MQADAAEPPAPLEAAPARLQQVDLDAGETEQPRAQQQREQQQPALPPPVLPPPAGDEWQQQQQRDGPQRASTPSNGFHALEIQSDGRSEDGSHYEQQLLAKGPTSGPAPHGSLMPPLADPVLDNPTEQLLPKPGPPPRPPGGVLPGGVSKRERLVMVSLFSLTAALLFADQNLMAPNLSAIAQGARRVWGAWQAKGEACSA